MGEKIDRLLKDLSDLVPDSAKRAQQEAQRCIKAGAEPWMRPLMQKLNLVSREEYDIQVALVERLQQKLRDMQARLDELEKDKS